MRVSPTDDARTGLPRGVECGVIAGSFGFLPFMRLAPLMLIRWLLLFVAIGSLRAAPAVVEATHGPLKLRRGAFEVMWFHPSKTAVRGLCVLGSGDGGWSYWEERVANHLAKKGWAVAGVDFAKYAEHDFSQAILAADYAQLVAELARRAGEPSDGGTRPVIYGGWSMGAEQSLPAAAVLAERPAGLRGLLLVAPGPRGRYGLRTADELGFAPTGEGTFALADFAPQLRDLRLAQLHAGLDPLDSIKWHRGLGLDLKLWKYPRAWHDFDGASDEFLALLDESIAWLLKPPAKSEESHE